MRVRDESYNPTTIINNKEGTPLLTNTDRKTRWKEYFEELYDPNAVTKYIYIIQSIQKFRSQKY
jgi:hypothetical protein